jgi:hypothetical protein
MSKTKHRRHEYTHLTDQELHAIVCLGGSKSWPLTYSLAFELLVARHALKVLHNELVSLSERGVPAWQLRRRAYIALERPMQYRDRFVDGKPWHAPWPEGPDPALAEEEE